MKVIAFSYRPARNTRPNAFNNKPLNFRLKKWEYNILYFITAIAIEIIIKWSNDTNKNINSLYSVYLIIGYKYQS